MTLDSARSAPSVSDFAAVLLALHQSPSSAAALERLVFFATAAAGCEDAGVLLTQARNKTESVAATSDVARQAQELQRELDEGPCLDALDGPVDSVTVSTELTDEIRWPTWAERVTRLGVRSAMCLPLATSSRRYGSLNLYSSREHAFSDDVRDKLVLLTEHASLALAVAQDNEGLRLAVESRKVVGIATGIVMERFDLDEERAFAVLKRHSQDLNIRLRAVAEQLIESGELPERIDRRDS